MKGKLIKVDTGWILMVDNKIYASHNDILSLKNCKAIERGYDLDELAYEKSWNEDSEKGFINGANAVLYLIGDKKFSEKDMSKAWSEGYHRRVDEINGNELRYFDKFIQSLQKTEWEVEVEMERSKFIADKSLRNDIKNGFNYTPKLDADGCLILKKI